MLTISVTQETRDVMKAVTDYDSNFTESQKLRMNAIYALKQAGDALLAIKDKFDKAGASSKNPVECEFGIFTGFDDYLIKGAAPVKKSAAYNYIKLAKNWHIVDKLGMQDPSNKESLAKSMRLCRTLKVIDWYNTQVALGRPEEELTLDAYWAEESAPTFNAGITKRQLELENNSLKQEVARLTAELTLLKESYSLT